MTISDRWHVRAATTIGDLRTGRLGLAALAVAVACVGLGLLVTVIDESVLVWLAALALSAIAWPTLRRRSWAGVVMVYGLLAFGVSAALMYRPDPADFHGGHVALAYMAERTPGYRYLLVFVAAASATWVGSLAVASLVSRTRHHKPLAIALRLPSKALPVAAIPLIADIYGTGPSLIFHAAAYLERSGPDAAIAVGHGLGPIAVVICGYLAFDRKQRPSTRAFALLLAFAYEIVFLATASRSFGFWFPLMFAGGVLTGAWSTRRMAVSGLATALAAVLALEVPLGLRSLPEHGLIPILGYLFNRPSLVFGSVNPLNNLLFGAPLALYVAHYANSLPISTVVTSVNPLPSSFTNWSQIQPQLRLNTYVPYSALGELLNHGWLFFGVLLALFAAGFSLVEGVAQRGVDTAGAIGRIVVVGAAALFVVECTQYNLREAARLPYYAFAAVVFVRFAATQLQQGRRHKQAAGGATAGATSSVRPRAA